MNTIEHTNSLQKVKEFVVAFTDGDCNHLASEIVKRFPQRYDFVLSCYYDLISNKHGNPHYETYWNHAMVRDIITRDIIDIEGVHDIEYFTDGKWKMGEDITMYVHTIDETTLISHDIDIALGKSKRFYPQISVDEAILYMQNKGWIISD